ncbi:MAG: hypothetical protein K8F59_17035 [Rhodobacteraceae bacterium]|nr:hypothetical protein [Paracoccaceae bacterium]
MTVLLTAPMFQQTKGFAPHGRYSYLRMLLMFAGDWHADMPDVRVRIARLETGHDFATLFRDIITGSDTRCSWVRHPQARVHLTTAIDNCITAWDHNLVHMPDRDQSTLDYLADALIAFKQATRD